MHSHRRMVCTPAAAMLRHAVQSVLVLSLALGTASAVELTKASVTEAYNTVTYQSDAQSVQKSASKGTVIRPQNIVRTGAKSRAELQFDDLTITRLGANTVFTFDPKADTVELRQGSILFSKPKEGGSFDITTPAATCAISGTTGFVEVLPVKKEPGKFSFMFGLVEGKSRIGIHGKNYTVDPGRLLVMTPDGSVRIVDFNIPVFLQKAGLMKGFKSTLPNQAKIDSASAKFTALEKRGFVQNTSLALATNGDQIVVRQGTGAGYTPALFDSAIQRLDTIQAVRGFEAAQAQRRALEQEILLRSLSQVNAVTTNPINNGFQPIGGSGAVRGQLVWQSNADLDLHLLLPTGEQVSFSSPSVTFNQGMATATLDIDNRGGTINVPPNNRVENIVVNGVVPAGNYGFYVVNFASQNPTDAYTLRATGNGGTTVQTQTGSLTYGATGPTLNVAH